LDATVVTLNARPGNSMWIEPEGVKTGETSRGDFSRHHHAMPYLPVPGKHGFNLARFDPKAEFLVLRFVMPSGQSIY
jgi:hypothetical protein